MQDIKGFRGFCFDPAVTGNLDAVITPPYDVISDEERDALAARSPHNMVHVLLPREGEGRTRYERAADTFERWIDEGALKQDDAPHFYLVRQTFTDLVGDTQVRKGFFAAVHIPDPDQKLILGHERTFDKPIEDRLRLTEAVKANLGAVFVLYGDPEGMMTPFLEEMEKRPAEFSAHTIDGVRQEFWRILHNERIAEFLRGKRLYIADGHHRFQTACAYREAMHARENAEGPRPYDYVLMGFVAFEDPGLKIYPPHRLVPRPEGFEEAGFLEELRRWFKVERVDADLPGTVEKASGDCVMGVAIHGGGQYLLNLKKVDRTEFLGDDRGPAWRDLDVAVLHRGIIERILGIPEGTVFKYEKDAENAVKAAETGEAGLSFLLRATRAEQIRACAEAGEPMPQKSTYFFPKLPSGGVIHRLA